MTKKKTKPKARPRVVRVVRLGQKPPHHGTYAYPRKAATSSHPLALALHRAAYSQRQLAEEAGCQQGDISRVLTGHFPRFAAGTAAKLYPIVKEWGVTMEDLILTHKGR